VIARRRVLLATAAVRAGCTGVSMGAFPLCAQTQGKTYRVGYLSPRAGHEAVDDAFIRAMREFGYAGERNLVVEYRWAGNDLDRLPPLADELVRLEVDVIVTATTAGTRAAMRATRSIPIVMAAVADPVAAGLVASLGRPGGNVTGMSLRTIDLARKRLQLTRELVPGARRIALLAERVAGATQGTTKLLVEETQAAATQMSIDLRVREVSRSDELADAFAGFRRWQAQAAIVQVSPLTVQYRKKIVELAAMERLPTMYEVRNFVDDGGLVSYGPDLRESYRRAAAYVDRIFKGAKPADLPIEQPDKFELVINMNVASALGLAIPQTLRMRAETLP
jgi:putative ABC transport system substrate-binding protein